MIHQLQQSLWQQFGAAIDMLMNVISTCPNDYLASNKRFYYLAAHSIFFLDYYSSIPPGSFSPALSFTHKPPEQRPAGSVGDLVPDEIYSKESLLGYLDSTRMKCKELVESLSVADNINLRFKEGDEEDDMDYSIIEIVLYNLRHTQHHVGQLNLMIRQDLDKHMDWAFRVDEVL